MKITVYTVNDCQFSKKEKEYLKTNNLSFEERNLEKNREYLAEMMTISNNFAGTPVTKIEKDDGQIVVLKGFTKDEFDKTFGLAKPEEKKVDNANQADNQPSSPPQNNQKGELRDNQTEKISPTLASPVLDKATKESVPPVQTPNPSPLSPITELEKPKEVEGPKVVDEDEAKKLEEKKEEIPPMKENKPQEVNQDNALQSVLDSLKSNSPEPVSVPDEVIATEKTPIASAPQKAVPDKIVSSDSSTATSPTTTTPVPETSPTTPSPIVDQEKSTPPTSSATTPNLPDFSDKN